MFIDPAGQKIFCKNNYYLANTKNTSNQIRTDDTFV